MSIPGQATDVPHVGQDGILERSCANHDQQPMDLLPHRRQGPRRGIEPLPVVQGDGERMLATRVIQQSHEQLACALGARLWRHFSSDVGLSEITREDRTEQRQPTSQISVTCR